MKKIVRLAMVTAFVVPLNSFSMNGDVVTDSSRVYDIEEVYVVDQPKEIFRLRQQPLSSTSFNKNELKRFHVEDLRQLSSYVPSFAMPQYGSRLTSSMYIRGIGSRINAPAAGIYIDGMPILNKSAFNFHTYGIERIDVLSGPQGTLYGMNTEGGLVRVYSKNPMTYQGTDINLSFGNKGYRKVEIGNYVKYNERLAYSISGFYNAYNGFLKNAFTGEKADKMTEFGAKGRLVLGLSERLKLNFISDYQYVRQNAFPYGELVDETTIANVPITSPYYSLKPGTQLPQQNRQSNYRRNLLNTGLGLKYVGNSFDINSMTTWQFLKDYMMMDNDYTAKDFMHLEQRQLSNVLTEELTIKSKHNKAWHWTFGAFGSYQWLKTNAPIYFNNDMTSYLSKNITDHAYNGILNAMAKGMAKKMIDGGMPEEQAMAAAKVAAAAAIEKAGGVKIGMSMDPILGLFRTPTLNAGIFHESNISVTPKLTATLGLRYDYSHVKIDYLTSAKMIIDAKVMAAEAKPIITSTLSSSKKNHFSQLLPKIGLTYKLDKGSNVYASWSKGYRAGGFNFQMFSDILQTELSQAARTVREDTDLAHDAAYYEQIGSTIEYKPETSWNYEAGIHLNLLQSRLHLNVSAYYMDIKNQQLSVMAGNYGFGRMMTNAGRSHSCGIEATVRGSALEDKLLYGGSYGYTNSKFKEYKEITKEGELNYKGNFVPFIPQHTFSAFVDYKQTVDPAALIDSKHPFRLRTVTYGLNVNGQGKTYWDNRNELYQNLYATIGGHIEGDFGSLKLNLWVKNLTDTRYNTFAIESAATGKKFVFAQLGNPFQIGIDMSYHF